MSKGLSQRSFVGIAVFVSVFLLAALAAVPARAVCYVKVSATGSMDCSSWGDACTLQTALTTGACTEIWVEKGVYKPTATADRTISFDVKPGVAVYGGFTGTEFSSGQRDPAANVTVLSGDIDGNDSVDANGIDESYTDIAGNNSYHVVTMDGTSTPITQTTVLDGFTITGGSATGSGLLGNGGGLTCSGNLSVTAECSPRLVHLAFRGSNAGGIGGALYDHGANGGASSPTLTDVTFSANHAGQSGGAMFNDGFLGTSSPSLNRVTFSGNRAGFAGGAIYDAGYEGTSSPVLTNVTFKDNQAVTEGGAIFSDGGGSGTSNPILTNVTFNGNKAPGFAGGAIFNSGTGGTCNPQLTNVILWGDTSPHGPEIYNYDSGGTVGPTINYSVVDGGDAGSDLQTAPGTDTAFSSGTGNLLANPNLGALQNNGGFTETIALLPGSSAIDTGTNSGCPSTDQRVVARPQDGDGNGTAICDIGAYEVLLPVTAIPALSVKGLALLGLLLAAGALAFLRRS